MTKLKAVLGYTLAILMLPIALATFFGMGAWGRLIAGATGVTVSPWCDGGEVRTALDHGSYRALVHRPVFDALIGQRSKGFVQVDWIPSEGLPSMLEEEIDYDGDGTGDFRLRLDTAAGRTTLLKRDECVLAVKGPYKLDDAWSVRVELERR